MSFVVSGGFVRCCFVCWRCAFGSKHSNGRIIVNLLCRRLHFELLQSTASNAREPKQDVLEDLLDVLVEVVALDGLVELGLEAVVLGLLLLKLLAPFELNVLLKLNALKLVLFEIILNLLEILLERPPIELGLLLQLKVDVCELERFVVEFLELLLNGLVLILVLVLVLEFLIFEPVLLTLEANVFLDLLALIIEPLTVLARCSRLLEMVSKLFPHSLFIELSPVRCLFLLTLLFINS